MSVNRLLQDLEYLTQEEAGEFAGRVGVSTITRWRISAGLPFIKPRPGKNSTVLIKKADLVEFLESRKVRLVDSE